MVFIWRVYEAWKGERIDTVLSSFSKSMMWKLVLKSERQVKCNGFFLGSV